MKRRLHILVAGRVQQDLRTTEAILAREINIELTTRVTSNGHVDPLHGLTTLPDVLILFLSAHWQEELNALATRTIALRLPIVVISPKEDLEIMRLALRAGARDFLTQPVSAEEIQRAIQQIQQEKAVSTGLAQHRTIAVLNAKGGSGATLIANNLAHIMAVRQQLPVALLDCDVQFGAQALCLDLRPTRDLVEAVNVVDELDAVALEGYMTKHQSGIHLLAAPTNRLVLVGELSSQNFSHLLEVIHQTYTRVVIDLPRLLDSAVTVALLQATTIIVAMQQTLAAMRDARRLTEILQTELDIPQERILVAINRYSLKHTISLAAIQQTLHNIPTVLIPNDYTRVEAATNQGIPLLEFAPNAPITQALVQLAIQLGGEEIAPAKGNLFRRALALFSGKPG